MYIDSGNKYKIHGNTYAIYSLYSKKEHI